MNPSNAGLAQVDVLPQAAARALQDRLLCRAAVVVTEDQEDAGIAGTERLAQGLEAGDQAVAHELRLIRHRQQVAAQEHGVRTLAADRLDQARVAARAPVEVRGEQAGRH